MLYMYITVKQARGDNDKERLGYVCNPRSLKEGMEMSSWRTDELGSRLERPIYFECKLNEPMHIGMRLLHPAAADHSVSISRQQVQHIFRFSLRSRAGARPLSGGTGAMATGRTDELGSLPKGHGYYPFQCPVEASCAPIFWRRLGLPQEDQLLLLWYYLLRRTG